MAIEMPSAQVYKTQIDVLDPSGLSLPVLGWPWKTQLENTTHPDADMVFLFNSIVWGMSKAGISGDGSGCDDEEWWSCLPL